VATDIYGEGSFSEHEAERTMLTDPASFSPYPYRESHLEVRHMDARELQFPDNSFDAVFSLSSIEHFGSWADIRRSASEMGRVLRPGGGVFIATECFLGRSAFGPRALQGPRSRPGGTTRIFTPRTLISEIVGPSGLELMQPLDTTAPETSANVFELLRGGGITSTTGAEYPHIALRVKKRLGIHTQSWTSVGLAMSKPSGQGLRQAISGRLSERVTNTKAPKTGLGQPSAGGSAPPCARAQVVPPQHRPGAALVPRPAQPTSARRCTSACAGRLIVVKTQTGNHNSDWLRRHSSGQPLSSMTP
jgi:hypothetical protein